MPVNNSSAVRPHTSHPPASTPSHSKGEQILLFIAGAALLSYGTWLTFREGKPVWPEIRQANLTLESVRKTAALIAPLLPGAGLMAVGAYSIDESSNESRLKKVGKTILLVAGVSLTALGLYGTWEIGKEMWPIATNGWSRNRPSWSFQLPFRTEPFLHHGQLCDPPSPLEKRIITVLAAPVVACFHFLQEFGNAMIAGMLFLGPVVPLTFFGGIGFAAAYYSLPNPEK